MTNNQKSENKIGIFSFFAGAGFLDLGFETTPSFETVFVNEYHEPFMEVYRASRNGLKIKEPIFGHNTEDISAFLEKQKARTLKENIQNAKKNFDLVGFIGGPPCPDFSVGGKNKGIEGENGKLSGILQYIIYYGCKTFYCASPSIFDWGKSDKKNVLWH